MPKYIVSGKHTTTGTIGNDSPTLDNYFELGWELGIVQFLIKSRLLDGTISNTDIIVTRKDREFIYTNYFDKVIDWETFITEKTDEDTVEYINSWLLDVLRENLKEKHYESDICNFDNIQNIEKRYNITDNFIIFCVRMRDHCDFRNSNIDTIRQVISHLEHILNIKAFIVGNGAEILETDKTKHINLRQFSSLLSSRKCKICISPMSGLVHITNFSGHDELVNIIFDHNNEHDNSHSLLMGDNINYKKVKNIFITEQETFDNILEHILKHFKKL